MSDQPEALRLAQLADVGGTQKPTNDAIAAELRRQHSHIESLEERCLFLHSATRDAQAFGSMYGDQVLELRARIEADEALMRQALETLRYYASVCGEDDQPTPAKTAITALRARLETSNV